MLNAHSFADANMVVTPVVKSRPIHDDNTPCELPPSLLLGQLLWITIAARPNFSWAVERRTRRLGAHSRLVGTP